MRPVAVERVAMSTPVFVLLIAAVLALAGYALVQVVRQIHADRPTPQGRLAGRLERFAMRLFLAWLAAGALVLAARFGFGPEPVPGLARLWLYACALPCLLFLAAALLHSYDEFPALWDRPKPRERDAAGSLGATEAERRRRMSGDGR